MKQKVKFWLVFDQPWAMDGNSPYMSVTWQQSVGIGFSLGYLNSEKQAIVRLFDNKTFLVTFLPVCLFLVVTSSFKKIPQDLLVSKGRKSVNHGISLWQRQLFFSGRVLNTKQVVYCDIVNIGFIVKNITRTGHFGVYCTKKRQLKDISTMNFRNMWLKSSWLKILGLKCPLIL